MTATSLKTVRDNVESFLATHQPSTPQAIRDHFGFGIARARDHLRELRKEGRVRPVAGQGAGSIFGVAREWELGEDPALEDTCQARRVFIKATDAKPIGYRDPLVSSLFGERGTVASRKANEPRCIACKAPEGEDHGFTCILARLGLVPGRRLLAAPQSVEVAA